MIGTDPADGRRASVHETAGQDDVTLLLSMFLRGRDVPCPLCG